MPLKKRKHIKIEKEDDKPPAEQLPDSSLIKKRSRSENEKNEVGTMKKNCTLPYLVSKHIENIRAMRAGANAPVDTMGCDKLQEEKADEKVNITVQVLFPVI